MIFPGIRPATEYVPIVLLCAMALKELHVALDLTKARQTRFIVFASATFLICMWAGGHYSLLADATAIKSGCVIAWKAIMTVQMAGLRGKEALIRNNKSSLPGLMHISRFSR